MVPRVAFEQSGVGEPWVLLHSFPLDRRMWASQTAALVASGRQVVTVDLPGFGGSESDPSAAPSLDRYAEAVLALLDEVGIAAATVLGLSLGGYVALRIAAIAPHRLRSLVLADTRAAADAPETRAGRVLNLGLVRSRGASALVDKLLPHLVAPGASARVRDNVRAWGAVQSTEALTYALLAMRDRADASEALASLRCPVLFIVGAEDGITPPASHHAMASTVPGARVEVLAGAGHLSNLEAPEAFNAALLRWANGLPLP